MDFVCSERTVVSTGTTLSGMPSLSLNKAELLLQLFWLAFSCRSCGYSREQARVWLLSVMQQDTSPGTPDFLD